MNTACKTKVGNSFNLKNPLNLILVSHKPEREFVKSLVKEENAKRVDPKRFDGTSLEKYYKGKHDQERRREFRNNVKARYEKSKEED